MKLYLVTLDNSEAMYKKHVAAESVSQVPGILMDNNNFDTITAIEYIDELIMKEI